jgi:hypothetical protein
MLPFHLASSSMPALPAQIYCLCAGRAHQRRAHRLPPRRGGCDDSALALRGRFLPALRRSVSCQSMVFGHRSSRVPFPLFPLPLCVRAPRLGKGVPGRATLARGRQGPHPRQGVSLCGHRSCRVPLLPRPCVKERLALGRGSLDVPRSLIAGRGHTLGGWCALPIVGREGWDEPPNACTPDGVFWRDVTLSF